MTLVAYAAMPTVGEMAAAIPSIVATAAGNGLACSAFLRCWQNHPSKEKQHRASEHHQQNSEMYPTVLGHRNSPLFPRPGRQFNSTKRM